MDWLTRMNQVINHIEGNLTQPISYEALARIVGCSVYEFSRIFSFLTGMPVSEYIRHRRLSQAVFDLQSSEENIIDIALKYCYESPTSFTWAFKELHHATPTEVRKGNVPLKLTPLWREFMDHYNPQFWNGGEKNSYYTAPFWQVAVYAYHSEDGKTKTIIGAEFQEKKTKENLMNGMVIETVPAITWAVFSICSATGIDHVPAAYTRILTEWFP